MTVDLSADQAVAENLLRSVDAWTTGHFLLTSGLHGKEYMQCQRVMQYPRHGMELARMLAKQLSAAGLTPNVVAGPALGAIHWEVYVASAFEELNKGQPPIKAIFAERVTDQNGDANSFAIRRGIALSPEDKVLVVEDVTTTGGSARKVIDLVRSLGATPIAVGAVVDRSGSTIDFGIPFHKLITLSLETFAPESCPLCKEGSPAIKPGSSNKPAK
ncbi:MAG TPA: orotate phosphoribosyltransferase [Drouetiella sp.]